LVKVIQIILQNTGLRNTNFLIFDAGVRWGAAGARRGVKIERAIKIGRANEKLPVRWGTGVCSFLSFGLAFRYRAKNADPTDVIFL